jgi:DHA1 family bicyclomycin/chloramphenicol resistance-like MFS transporter
MHNNVFSYQERFFIVLCAFFIIPISGLAIDIYVPSLPAVANFFHASKSDTQLTVSAYMLGLGVIQLFSGGISDSFGRRKPFLLGMIAFIMTTTCILFTKTIFELILLRCLQGVCIAIIVVPIRAIVADLFEGTDYFKMANYMTLSWSIGPIIAPFIGGYIQQYFHWYGNFYFLLIYASISLITMYLFIPETSKHRHPFILTALFKRFLTMLSTPFYLINLLQNSLLYSLIILFSIEAPFLIQKELHYSAVTFGHIALLTGLMWFLGTIINRLLHKLPMKLKQNRLIGLLFVLILINLIIQATVSLTLYSFILPLFSILIVGGVLFPDNYASAILKFPTYTASANALFGGLLFFFTGIVSFIGSLLKTTSSVPLAMAYLIIIILISILQRIRD